MIFICYFTGHAMVRLFEKQYHKQRGCCFDSRWCHWNFSLPLSFLTHNDPRVDSASNRNEYQEYFLGDKGDQCVGLTNLPLSCADCLEIRTASNFWKPPGLYRDWYTFFCYFMETSRNKLRLYLLADGGDQEFLSEPDNTTHIVIPSFLRVHFNSLMLSNQSSL